MMPHQRKSSANLRVFIFVFHHLPVSDASDVDNPNKQAQELQQIGRQKQAEKSTILRELTEGANMTPTRNQTSSANLC
jgi:hypothetical protein